MKTKSSIENRSVGLLGPAAGVFIHSYFAMGVQSQAIAEQITKRFALSANGRRWLHYAMVFAAAVATLLAALAAALVLAITAFMGLLAGLVALVWILPRRLNRNLDSALNRPIEQTDLTAARPIAKRHLGIRKNHEQTKVGIFAESNA